MSKRPGSEEEVLLREEVARMLRLPSARCVDRLRRKGILPSIAMVGRSHKYLKSSVLDVLRRLQGHSGAGGDPQEPPPEGRGK